MHLLLELGDDFATAAGILEQPGPVVHVFLPVLRGDEPSVGILEQHGEARCTLEVLKVVERACAPYVQLPRTVRPSIASIIQVTIRLS